MHYSRLSQIILDCQVDDIDAAAAFWSAALGRPAHGLPDPEDSHYRKLETGDDEPNLLLQRVDHSSRVHLDLDSDDVEAEVRRLEHLGARRVAQVRTWWVMEAPTGHRFCVLGPQRPGLEARQNLRS
jgi:predicted enzyme related to lactoylglutathione lyase